MHQFSLRTVLSNYYPPMLRLQLVLHFEKSLLSLSQLLRGKSQSASVRTILKLPLDLDARRRKRDFAFSVTACVAVAITGYLLL